MEPTQQYFEQSGPAEDAFACELANRLYAEGYSCRAYLFTERVQGSQSNAVCLGLRIIRADVADIIQIVSEIFSNLFGCSESLDIRELSDEMELIIRQSVYPIYSSVVLNISDFYLDVTEGFHPGFKYACHVRHRLHGINPDGYIFCEVDPPFRHKASEPTESSGILLAARHVDQSLFNMTDWPKAVHIAEIRHAIDDRKRFEVAKGDARVIAWGEIDIDRSDKMH